MRPLCEDLAKQKKWISGDTVRWNERYIPDFRTIVEKSKAEAARNSSFKTALESAPSRSYSAQEIDEWNAVRLRKECGGTTDQLFNCTHFQADCSMQMNNVVLTDALKNFSWCALHPVDSCGTSFQTPQGVADNLASLEKAFQEIEKLREQIEKNPAMKEYFLDVEGAFSKLHDLYEEALKNKENALKRLGDLRADEAAAEKLRAGVLSNADQANQNRYNQLYAQDQNFRRACDVLNKCDDYLAKKGLSDSHSVISQINICQVDVGKPTNAEIEQFSEVMEHLKETNDKRNLLVVASKSLDNAIALTTKEFAHNFKAITGRAPTLAETCARLNNEFCQHPVAQKTLQSLGAIPEVNQMNFLAEIRKFNQAAEQMNALCRKAKSTPNVSLYEAPVQQQLTAIMYQTRVGQLMGFEEFRKKIPPFDQDSCLKKGVGFKTIPATLEGEALLKRSTEGLMKLQKDKANLIKKNLARLGQGAYHGKYMNPSDPDYEELLRDLLENDPFTVREAIRASGSPDQALWLCRATSDIYSREKTERVWKWVGTGACVAGSLAATVFTGGAAAPLLIGSIAMGTGMGVYSLNQAWTRQHNREMSAAISSSDPVINMYALKAADEEEKAAYVEIGLGLLPAAMKGAQLGGKALSPLVAKTPLVSKVLAGGAQSYNKLDAAGKAIVDALKKGQTITQEMLMKGLGEKFAKAGGKGMVLVGDFLRGAAPDAAMEFATALAIHPDPLSEDAIRSMLQGVAFGSAMRLGAGGMRIMRDKALTQFETARSAVGGNPAPSALVETSASRSSSRSLVVNSETGTTLPAKNSAPLEIEVPGDKVPTQRSELPTKQSPPTTEAPVNRSADVVTATTPRTNKNETVIEPGEVHDYAAIREKHGSKNIALADALSEFKSGDVVKFSDGKQFKIKEYLGGGSSTAIYELEDGTVLRVNKRRQTTGMATVEDFRKGYAELKDSGIPLVKILDAGSSSNEYCIVEKIHMKPGFNFRSAFKVATNGVSEEEKARLLKAWGMSQDEVRQSLNDFQTFIKKTSGYANLDADFHSEQIVYDTKRKEWVLADYGGGTKKVDAQSMDKTVFDNDDFRRLLGDQNYEATRREVLKERALKPPSSETTTNTIVPRVEIDPKSRGASGLIVESSPVKASAKTASATEDREVVPPGPGQKPGSVISSFAGKAPRSDAAPSSPLPPLGPQAYTQEYSQYRAYEATHPVINHIRGDFSYLQRDGLSQAKIDGGLHSMTGINFLKRVRPDIAHQISLKEFPNGVIIADLPESAFYSYRFSRLSKKNIVTKSINGEPVRFTQKGLFPKSWKDEDVLKAVNEVKNNKASFVEARKDVQIVRGKYQDVDIELIIKDGNIETAYPLAPE